MIVVDVASAVRLHCCWLMLALCFAVIGVDVLATDWCCGFSCSHDVHC